MNKLQVNKINLDNIKKESWLAYDGENIRYYDYWNNEALERFKEFYIVDGNYEKMETYLNSIQLPDQIKTCVDFLLCEKKIGLYGNGIDLAAGNLWAVPHLFTHGDIQHLYCLDYSYHRIFKIGPYILEKYNVPIDKVTLIHGSFYDLKLSDNSLDFVFLSQAFHHASDPGLLLAEIKRVLKPRAPVIIVGEHMVKISKIFKAKFKQSFQFPYRRKGDLSELINDGLKFLIPSDPVTGDHYYLDDEYKTLFHSYGFSYHQFKYYITKSQSFILVNDDNDQNTTL